MVDNHLNPGEAADIGLFKKALDGMVVKNKRAYKGYDFLGYTINKTYSRQEIEDIIASNNIISQQQLSRYFFNTNGLYRRILTYYATLLQYVGILIPNPIGNNELSTPHIKKKYDAALDYIEKFFLPKTLTQISLSALVDGCYYGVIKEVSKTNFALLDLPVQYCRSNFKDLYGNDIIEFNVNYFDTLTDSDVRQKTLQAYPFIISKHYKAFKSSKVKSSWIKIPTDIGFCFPFTDNGQPFFLDLILAILDYDDAKAIDKERDLEEIRKIIVQKIPHIADGTLVFEPPEAEEMHAGAVDMMSGNKNVSILTTYADVEAVVSKTSSEAVTNTLEKHLQNVYTMGSVSGQLFAPTGSQALSTSITNDMSLMMGFVNKISVFLTYIINYLFSNTNVNFKYTILPITWYNVTQYITDTLKLAQSGYSFLLPAVAVGLSQKDLINVKNLENDVLKLGDKLIPLESSYTQGTGQVGRPQKPLEEKSPKTLQNEEALNNQ